MRLANNLTEYGFISKAFHWVSAAALVVQIPLGFYLVDLDFNETRLTIESIHVVVGLSIFYLTILRLIYKIFNPTPSLGNSIFPGQRLIAKMNHVFLYITILTITISGALKKLFNGEILDLFFFNLEIKDNFEEVQKSIVCLCISAVVRKTVSTLRFFEYLKFIRSLKVKIPKLKKKISEEILYHLNYSSLKILRVLSVFY